MEKLIINIFISSIICFVFYLLTAIIMWYTDRILLHNEPVGIMALMLYFIIPFITIRILDIENV